MIKIIAIRMVTTVALATKRRRRRLTVWACPKCTFENPLTSTQCEMCHTKMAESLRRVFFGNPEPQVKPALGKATPGTRREALAKRKPRNSALTALDTREIWEQPCPVCRYTINKIDQMCQLCWKFDVSTPYCYAKNQDKRAKEIRENRKEFEKNYYDPERYKNDPGKYNWMLQRKIQIEKIAQEKRKKKLLKAARDRAKWTCTKCNYLNVSKHTACENCRVREAIAREDEKRNLRKADQEHTDKFIREYGHLYGMVAPKKKPAFDPYLKKPGRDEKNMACIFVLVMFAMCGGMLTMFLKMLPG